MHALRSHLVPVERPLSTAPHPSKIKSAVYIQEGSIFLCCVWIEEEGWACSLTRGQNCRLADNSDPTASHPASTQSHYVPYSSSSLLTGSQSPVRKSDVWLKIGIPNYSQFIKKFSFSKWHSRTHDQTAKRGCHVKADRSGIYHCCETGAVLVEMDRCVTSGAADFKQSTAHRKENLEGIWVCFCSTQHVFDACRELFIVYLPKGLWWFRAEVWGASAQPVFALDVEGAGGGRENTCMMLFKSHYV